MPAKREKLNLFMFIDAFGWEVKQRHPEFLQGLVHDSKPLETILGYSSACDPSIISGRTPAEHGLWSSYYYDPDGSPFKWTRPLRFLPDTIFRRGRVRSQMSRWVRKRCEFTGYFQLYGIPFEYLHLFNYAEQKRIWEPGGLPRGESIFDRMMKEGISYHVHDSDVGDDIRCERLLTDIRNRRINFAYCSLGRLDALMHTVGNDHPDIDHLMKWYDGRIRELLDAAEENYDEVSWYVFTDHGMHNVTEGCDLAADIETIGLEWNRDYAAFYDSTMARFWFLNEQARSQITAFLNNHSKGRILSDDELRAFGVCFDDRQYGDLIFLMNPGIQIVPSFMGVEPLAGMHGYDPAEADSFASISSNRLIPETVTRIQHIHQIMLKELGVRREA